MNTVQIELHLEYQHQRQLQCPNGKFNLHSPVQLQLTNHVKEVVIFIDVQYIVHYDTVIGYINAVTLLQAHYTS